MNTNGDTIWDSLAPVVRTKNTFPRREPVFAVNYGSSLNDYAERLGVTEEQLQEFRKRFLALYPELQAYAEQVKSAAYRLRTETDTKGYVTVECDYSAIEMRMVQMLSKDYILHREARNTRVYSRELWEKILWQRIGQVRYRKPEVEVDETPQYQIWLQLAEMHQGRLQLGGSLEDRVLYAEQGVLPEVVLCMTRPDQVSTEAQLMRYLERKGLLIVAETPPERRASLWEMLKRQQLDWDAEEWIIDSVSIVRSEVDASTTIRVIKNRGTPPLGRTVLWSALDEPMQYARAAKKTKNKPAYFGSATSKKQHFARKK